MAESPFGHEPPAVDAGRVLAAVGLLAAFVVISVVALHFVLHDAVMPRHAQVLDARGVIPPAPRLQPHPQIDIAAERAQKRQMLSRYLWLDSSRSFARIPIQRAMQLYVQQHSARQPVAATPASGTSR